MLYKKNKIKSNHLKGIEPFEGVSIEKEMQEVLSTNSPIQRTANNMYYTPRKEGVLPSNNIRTDRWELAQQAMQQANEDFQQRIKERIEKQKESEQKIE